MKIDNITPLTQPGSVNQGKSGDKVSTEAPKQSGNATAGEVAHLRHMDHSPAFWAVLDGLYPERRAASAWLRAEGPTLHRYRFRD